MKKVAAAVSLKPRWPAATMSPILYTGEQLDAGDNDVFLHAMRLSQGLAPGGQVHFVRSTSSKRSAGNQAPRVTSAKGFSASASPRQLFIEDGEGKGKMFRLVKDLRGFYD